MSGTPALPSSDAARRRKEAHGFPVTAVSKGNPHLSPLSQPISQFQGDPTIDLMVAAVEHRFGRINRLPVTIEVAIRQPQPPHRWQYPQLRSRHRS